MPYKIKKQNCKMKSGESGEAVRYRKVTHGDGSVSLKKAACHDSVASAYAAVAKIHDSHMTDDALTEELYETIIQRVLTSEAVSAADARNVEVAANIYLDNAHAKKNKDHIRIHSNQNKSLSEEQKLRYAIAIIRTAFELSLTRSKNVGKTVSKTYDSYEVTGQNKQGADEKYYIIFAGTQTSGIRGGGYQYEKDIANSLLASGISVDFPGDPAKTDVYVSVASLGGANIGIEVKAAGARFGEPTIAYTFKYENESNKTPDGTVKTELKAVPGKFKASDKSKSSKSVNLIVDILNAAGSSVVHDWMMLIQNAWNSFLPENAQKISEYGSQVTIEEYEKYIRSKNIPQSAPAIPIPLETLIQYYTNKGAIYFQIQGKGLYSIADVLNINATSFAEAASSIQPSVKVQILTSNQRKVLRATINLDFSKMNASSFSLDNPEDLAVFARKCSDVTNVNENFGLLKVLISEELTASDKREIERISRRQARIELERAVGPDLGKAIREEVSKTLGSRATREEITDMIEAVLKRLHVEIGH